LPGISRSGSAIVAALLLRLDHEDAARYSFLLATPVIFAASALEVPKLFAPDAAAVLAQASVGGIVAAITAYASIAFLTRWFHSHDLRPFGWYCLIFGAACLALALTKVIS
jgi:undecaprenyl-diphosphatase